MRLFQARYAAPLIAAATLGLAAPGSTQAEPAPPSEFQSWVQAAPRRASDIAQFEQYLRSKSVDGILPTYQLLRTASDWKACKADKYAVPPQADWPHVVRTLEFIRDKVVPRIGALEAVSGYRSPDLNRCAQGGKTSAHLGYYALDLIPLDPSIDRRTLITKICAVHAADGAEYATGLGFYDGVRFHLDSKGFRKWGPDKHAASSPCNTGI